MKFKVISNALVAACEDSSQFIALVTDIGECELFSNETIRTIAQNSKLWPMLTDISKQVELFEAKHTPVVWKHIISAAWKAQYFVRGIGGTLVVIPVATSKLSKKAFSELIECIYAYGSDEGVEWSEPALRAYSEYREAA